MRAGLLAIVLLSSCAAHLRDERAPAPDGGWTPPAAWSEMTPAAFERVVLEELRDDRVTPLDPAALAELAAALDGPEETALRAAVLLARSRAGGADEALLARLERRVPSPERPADAVDVVAAAGLLRFAEPRRFRAALAALAAGPRPHPDLEVRVECAAGALALGDDSPIPFLLAVLRVDTRAGLADQRDFEVSTTTAWARGRAARALSRRAGVETTYHPDASMRERQREAARLADLLGR